MPPLGPQAVTTAGLCLLLSPFCLPVPVMTEPETPSYLSPHLPSLPSSASESGGEGTQAAIAQPTFSLPGRQCPPSVQTACSHSHSLLLLSTPAGLTRTFHSSKPHPGESLGPFLFCSGPFLEEDWTLSQLLAFWEHPTKSPALLKLTSLAAAFVRILQPHCLPAPSPTCVLPPPPRKKCLGGAVGVRDFLPGIPLPCLPPASPGSNIGFPGNLSKPLLWMAVGTPSWSRAGLLESSPLFFSWGHIGTYWGLHSYSGKCFQSNQHCRGEARRQRG